MRQRTILSLLPDRAYSSVDVLISDHQKNYPNPYFYRPIGIEVEITNACNLHCRGCALIVDELNKPKDTLVDEHFIHVLKECKKLGMFAYSLTGGEPFLKFKTITAILKANHGMDLYKLNTNATYFKTQKLMYNYFSELMASGFAKNNVIKSVLVISLGHQNLAGAPLINAVHAASQFYKFFSRDKATCSINITEKNPLLAQKIYKDFTGIYKNITGKPFNDNIFPVRFFRLNYVPTLERLELLTGPKVSIKQRIDEFKKEYLSGGCFNIRIMNRIMPDQSETLVPRCVLRPNGDVYACPGYNRTHFIGNIGDRTIGDIIDGVNQNKLLKTVFTKNLEGLYKLALKHNTQVNHIQVQHGYGPCDICQVLTHTINKQPIKWPAYASPPSIPV